jgi:hypothetical protein
MSFLGLLFPFSENRTAGMIIKKYRVLDATKSLIALYFQYCHDIKTEIK